MTIEQLIRQVRAAASTGFVSGPVGFYDRRAVKRLSDDYVALDAAARCVVTQWRAVRPYADDPVWDAVRDLEDTLRANDGIPDPEICGHNGARNIGASGTPRLARDYCALCGVEVPPFHEDEDEVLGRRCRECGWITFTNGQMTHVTNHVFGCQVRRGFDSIYVGQSRDG